jgi:PAS domain S-box-containing protein
MEAMLSHHRILPTIAAFGVGIAIFSLIRTPFGLLAPVAALFLFTSSRTGLLLHVASAAGLVGSLLVSASYEGDAHDLAVVWAAFFALTICIGALVETRTPPSPSAEAMPAANRSATREETRPHPVPGPTLTAKVAPRNSPTVSLTAADDHDTAARMAAASFWGGTSFHVRYWRRLTDGTHRWTEIRTEPLHEPSGAQRWRGVVADIDDPNPRPQQPAKTASNPPNDDDAVRAAKVVERLLGNAWAFDSAGRPTYLTPIAQTFVAVTLEEFQATVDEGHTVFKRTSHPDEYDRISTAWRHSLHTGDPFYIERRIQRATGILDWSRTAIVPTRDSQGRVTGWYGGSIDLDAYRHAEAELRDRERELSQLVAMVPSHLWRLARDGEPIFFNQRMVDYLGLDVADLDKPGRTRLEVIIQTAIHPDDSANFALALKRCLATGEYFSMRYRMRRSDGVYRWMSSRAEPIRDQDGRIVQWYGLCQDIEDQMNAEEALREREQELSQLVNMVPAHIRRLTPEGEPIFFNKRLIDFFGLGDLSDLDKPSVSRLAAAIQTLVHADDATNLLEIARRSFASGEPFSMKYRMRRADGAYRWVDTRAEPLRNQSGAIVQWYVISLDIDDEVRAQQALRDRERELSQLVDMVPVYIRRLTPEGEPIFFNKRLTDFIGVGLAEIGTPMSRLAPAVENFIHPDEAAKLLTAIRRSLATGQGYAMKYRMRRADGVYRWIETRAEPVRNQEGTIAQWYAVSIDVDDEVRAQQAEEALRETSDKLAKATQAASLAELSASIAHEVNQPLAAVVANSHACQRWLTVEPPNLERAQKTVERIIRDANAAADVVSRIRALFRQSIDARVLAALEGVIAEARNFMADEASRRHVQMDIDIESDLPRIALDRVQIQQVLINLMRNGMEAMDTVADDKVLAVRARRMADMIQTEISDRGPGIAFPDRMFEPFYTTKEQGMGMGLAICRSIVESHGGRLWAEKNEPRGAMFVFTLPIEMKSAS